MPLLRRLPSLVEGQVAEVADAPHDSLAARSAGPEPELDAAAADPDAQAGLPSVRPHCPKLGISLGLAAE